MFDFLKPKTRIRPEELGTVLATAIVSTWSDKITERANELNSIADFTQSELHGLWQMLLMLHCTSISVGVETSAIEETNKQIILDAFWNSMSDLFRENASLEQSQTFEKNTATWYPEIREMMLEPNAEFGAGSLGPGKQLIHLAMPDRNIRESVDLVTEMTCEYASTFTALSKYATDCVKRSKLTKSLISI